MEEWNVNAKPVLVALFMLALAIVACTDTPAGPTPTPAPTPDIRPIVSAATQIREERMYLVTLKFKKEDPLDPWANAVDNELSAEHRTIIVGEKTFNQYQIGAEVSRKADAWSAFFDGNLFVSYVVRVEDKQVVSQYFWQDKSGQENEITKDTYELVLQRLKNAEKPMLTVPYAGVTVTYILNKPLSEYVFVDKKPLTRYFVRVQVKNETLTLDVGKLLRNAVNIHEIDLEVPKAVYEKTGEVWDPKISMGSLIFKGHLSTLHGIVIKKWTEDDPNFFVAITDSGESMIVPANRQ